MEKSEAALEEANGDFDYCMEVLNEKKAEVARLQKENKGLKAANKGLKAANEGSKAANESLQERLALAEANNQALSDDVGRLSVLLDNTDFDLSSFA